MTPNAFFEAPGLGAPLAAGTRFYGGDSALLASAAADTLPAAAPPPVAPPPPLPSRQPVFPASRSHLWDCTPNGAVTVVDLKVGCLLNRCELAW